MDCIDRFVTAFNARDLGELGSCLAEDATALSLQECLTQLTSATVHAERSTGVALALQRVVDNVVVDGLIALSHALQTSATVALMCATRDLAQGARHQLA